MIGLYVLGMAVGILYGLILKRFCFRETRCRLSWSCRPTGCRAAKHYPAYVGKGQDFIHRAFTIIFVATILIWFLQSFDFRLNMVADSANSMLAAIGALIAPIFVPLGFGSGRHPPRC